MLYKMNPTLTDPVVATTYFFTPHDSPPLSLSLSIARVSPTLVTVKLDCYSLLPLSLVSMSRNRTKGGRRSSSLCWGFDMKSVLSKLMEFCVCISVYGSMECGVCGCVCVHLWCICECVVVPEE